MSRSHQLVLVLVLLAGAVPARALDPSRRLTQYVHDVWRAPQALPYDGVSAVVQSRDGYLWVGTVEGLARFDGLRSVVFDKANTPAFANNWVKALLEDRRGRLWIGTYGGGLVCREQGRFRRLREADGLPQEIVLALAEDRQGRVWVGTHGGGLLRLEAGAARFEREPATGALEGATVRSLLAGRDGALWIGTEQGLHRLADGVLARVAGLPDERVISLAEDEQGLWIGTERAGLARLQGGHVTRLGPAQGLAHERVWSLYRDRDGSLWIGTDGGGLQRLREGRLESLSTRNGWPSDYVWAFHEDREGNLWVGTNGGGLSRLKDGRAVPFGQKEGLPSDFTWGARRTRDGSLWIGTEDAGLVRLQDGRVTRLALGPERGRNQVRALLEARDGTLWVGGSGLYRLENGRPVAVGLPALRDLRARALAEDDRGRIWIAAASEGVKCLGPGGRLEPQPLEALAVDAATVLAARDGTVWAGGPGGLFSTRDGLTRNWGTADGLPGQGVSSLAEDADGSLWIATRAGLARLSEGRVETLTARQGLPENAIAVVQPDDAGGLWLGSNRGLFRIRRDQALAAAAGRGALTDTLHLGLDDGLRSLEVNSSGSSAWKDPDGQLWFATRAGLARVDPGRLARDPLPPPVAIEEVLADERPLEGSGPWRLPPGTLRLEIHYTGLSLRSPGAVRFKRKLEGFDADWVDAGAKRVADYTNLPHGRYRFDVLAANDDGLWSPQAARVEFEIAPRLHETLWFRALAVAFFALAGPLFYLVRVRRLRGQKVELERQVAARTVELQAATERLAQLSREDPLTGVANRRRLDEALEDEWRRATRQREPLALLLLDVDFFKSYNDRLGHVAGDICLQAVARAVADAHRRAGEVVARYGGEEFAVLLPGTARAEALAAGEALRRRVQELDLPHPGSDVARVVTVSVGVASLGPQTGRTPTELLVEADRALYRAKSGGRNRVEG